MYDFDTPIDRRNTGALKWDRRTPREKALGLIPMSVADMEFRTAPCVQAAVERAAAMGLYGYTDPEEHFFEAVLGWLSARHGVRETPDSLVCLYGVVPALSAAVRAFTDPGDKVIIQTPVYYPFSEAVGMNGRVIARNPLVEEDGRYRMDYDGLEELARDPRTKLMLLCSPHNPVGRVWTAAELERTAEICLRHGVTIVSDEIHFDIVLEGRHTVFSTLSEEIRQNVIVCTSASKTFNTPGLQVCTMVIPNPTLRRRFVDQIHADGFSNISYFGYAATIAAYEGGADWVDALLGYLRGNRACFEAFMTARVPAARLTRLEGTYLQWVDFRALGLSARELERFMRGEAGLILDEGYIFGPEGEGFERFNIALPRAQLTEALERLDRALERRGIR